MWNMHLYYLNSGKIQNLNQFDMLILISLFVALFTSMMFFIYVIVEFKVIKSPTIELHDWFVVGFVVLTWVVFVYCVNTYEF